jgi:hypothetical protein
VTIAPFIEWSKLPVWQRPLSIRLAIQATAPTGQYSPNDPVNAGSDAWQVSPYLAFTWRVSDRWEISGRSIYDWSGRSGRPPVSLDAANTQAGDQFAQNVSVSAAITDHWRLGVAGYGIWQLGDTRVDGQAVPKSRQQVIAVGPGLLGRMGMRQSSPTFTKRSRRVTIRGAPAPCCGFSIRFDVVDSGGFEAAADNQSTATSLRPCGRRKSSSGPTGTIRVGLIDVWL